MRVLMVGTNPWTNEALHITAQIRGCEITTVPTVTAAITAAHETEVDCVLFDIDTSSRERSTAVMEIRQLSMTSALVLMTELPVQRLVDEAISEASIQPLSIFTCIPDILRMNQPALVVASHRASYLRSMLVDEGLRVSVANTLRFAMNLLVDGWCQVVLMDAEIGGLTLPDTVALFHELDVTHLAILASADSGGSSGINWSMRPDGRGKLMSILEDFSANRVNAGGLRQSYSE